MLLRVDGIETQDVAGMVKSVDLFLSIRTSRIAFNAAIAYRVDGGKSIANLEQVATNGQLIRPADKAVKLFEIQSAKPALPAKLI